MQKHKKIRHLNNSSSLPPIWWQNSKVSYSYFASGSSSFLDFSILKENGHVARKDSFEGYLSANEKPNSQSSIEKVQEIVQTTARNQQNFESGGLQQKTFRSHNSLRDKAKQIECSKEATFEQNLHT